MALGIEDRYLDDGLAEKIIRLAREFLPQFRFDVVVFVPDANFDPIG